MIIRRHHTANFTIVTNDIFNDTRLTLEERGALGWLISRPHNWEVSRAGCAKLWGVGRDKARRILRRLVETGWAQGEMVRDEVTKTFIGMRYTVTDECGPEQAFVDDDGNPEEKPRPEIQSVDQEPRPENPCTGKASPEPLVSIELQRIPTPTPPKGGVIKIEDDSETKESFERFRSAYPITIEDEPRALKTWRLLSPADREIRITAAARYADEVKRYKRTPFAAHRWLGDGTPKREGRWQGYATTGTLTATAPTSSVVPFDSRAAKALVTVCRVLGMSSPPRCSTGYVCSAPITPQILALADAPPESEWIEHAIGTQRAGAWRSLRELLPPRWGMPRLEKIRSPWEWPPRIDGTLSPTGPSESTGPPQSLMTADDERALTDGL